MKLCGFDVGLDQRFFLIAGPCVIESMQLQNRHCRNVEKKSLRNLVSRLFLNRVLIKPTALRVLVFVVLV